MGRASTLSLHERGQIKPLSTAGCTVKQIADVVKRSRKAIMNPLHLQEENVKKEILRTALNNTTSIVGIRRTCGIDAYKNSKCPQLTQGDKHERLRWARIFMGCDWGKTQLLRVFKNKPIN
uniref:HTH_Tnp_Tc3_1 domain-containing protein n=1 Tax=Heterorhabditis bacteriophora TaxID=37862 RepID=A0A1I7WF35_HETBA